MSRTKIEQLRDALVEIGHDAANRAKLAQDPRDIKDFTQAAASALQAASSADQKAATERAVEVMMTAVLGMVEGQKTGKASAPAS